MKVQTLILAVPGCLLLFIFSVAAIVLDDGGSPFTFTTIQGETATIYGGAGPYRHDSAYKAIAFRSLDWVGLTLAFPMFGWGFSCIGADGCWDSF